MLVDVTFDGVSLVKGATARPDGSGWFVELEQPMPVGTLLAVSGETQATVRVERVVEGVGAGMLLLPAAADKTKAEATAPAPAKKPDKPEAKSDKAEKAAEPEGDDEPEGNGVPKGGNGTSKDRRKKTRKTVMGH